MACYRSEQYDPDLGLYYLRARYYNPATGRFLSVDPLADEGQRRYEYAAANPVDGMDPNGSEALIEYALVPHILPPVWIPNWCGLFGANPMGGNLPCKHQQPGKHFDYLIDSGALFKVDASGYPTYMGSGYSGKGAGLNNPSMEDVKGAKGKNDAGPIPEGKYTIGPMFNNVGSTGPGSMRLTPSPSNEMYERYAFLMHGDNKRHEFSASDGCIIMALGVRNEVSSSGIVDLEVRGW